MLTPRKDNHLICQDLMLLSSEQSVL